MKILLVIESDSIKDILAHHLKPIGFEIIHYKNPVKAIYNIDEIEPDLVLFSAEDFPRHWKPFVTVLRDSKTKEQTVFLLLKGDNFPFEEAAKASNLLVNGIISESFENIDELNHLTDVFCRYSMIKESRIDLRYIPKSYDDLEFLFTHPDNFKMITGTIVDISIEGLNFKPDNPQITTDIARGETIPYCSLKLGGNIFTLVARIIRNSENISFHFDNISKEVKDDFIKYINKSTERELQTLFH